MHNVIMEPADDSSADMDIIVQDAIHYKMHISKSRRDLIMRDNDSIYGMMLSIGINSLDANNIIKTISSSDNNTVNTAASTADKNMIETLSEPTIRSSCELPTNMTLIDIESSRYSVPENLPSSVNNRFMRRIARILAQFGKKLGRV